MILSNRKLSRKRRKKPLRLTRKPLRLRKLKRKLKMKRRDLLKRRQRMHQRFKLSTPPLRRNLNRLTKRMRRKLSYTQLSQLKLNKLPNLTPMSRN